MKNRCPAARQAGKVGAMSNFYPQIFIGIIVGGGAFIPVYFLLKRLQHPPGN
jgi:hypothetical protein